MAVEGTVPLTTPLEGVVFASGVESNRHARQQDPRSSLVRPTVAAGHA